jgi:hypothetical protein
VVHLSLPWCDLYVIMSFDLVELVDVVLHILCYSSALLL